MSDERLKGILRGMHQRCYNSKSAAFPWYGGKGVTVCPEWHDFETFKLWAISHGYADDLTIDRIDPDGNYEPENCRWITRAMNSSRAARRITEGQGISYAITQSLEYANMTQAELARILGTTPQAFNQRMKHRKFSVKELEHIAEIMGAKYKCYFTFPDGFKC